MSDPFDLSSIRPRSSAAEPDSPRFGTLREEIAGSLARAPHLDALNPEQRAAAEALDGPVLVLAGAGTGKTRVLVSRLAHILETRRAWPGQILAVTFTNKAAREMLSRVGSLIGPGAEGLWLGTFHAIGARILRRHAELVGLRPNFTILDADDQQRLLKQLMASHDIDDKKWPPRAALAVIQRWKDRGLTPDRVSAAEAGDFAEGRALDLYHDYQERLRTLNACDFGDLLLHGLSLFTAREDVLAEYRQRFRYMLVDEYQDTNIAQYLWLRLLATGGGNLCCVGDDDQSIYGWRGAEIGNILRFEKDFPGAKVIRLERNYRSTPEILATASGLIAHNRGRLGKTLWTEQKGGDRVVVAGVWDGETEARMIAEEIEALGREGTGADQIAVLVRTGSQTREFEERFITCAIPYRVIGGPRFYERAEIRDVLAYLRLIHQPEDDLAFERIVNVPRRGLGDASLRAIHALARIRKSALIPAAGALIGSDDLRPQARKSLADLLESLARWRRQAELVSPAVLAQMVMEESGYVAMWQKDPAPDAAGRLENLKELVHALDSFETLEGFLEHVALVMEIETADQGPMVSLMTLHAAKGLEFDMVFLPGWEEGLFPHQRALDEQGTGGLEEERRLAYVGLTRARRKAQISFAANRRLYNQWISAIPSRFIDELPRDQIDLRIDQGLYGGGDHGPRSLAEGGRAGTALRFAGRGSGAIGTAQGGEDSAFVIDPDPGFGHSQIDPGAPSPGVRIFHQKFGYGKVIAVEGEKLDIAFDKAGRKKVMAGFVIPA